MTAREAHQAQWEALKDKPLRDKLEHIFTYYWAAILGCVFLIVFLTSWIGGALSQKDTALSGYLLNGITRESYDGDFTQAFMDHQQIDSDKYSFNLTADVSYSSTEISDTTVAVLESIVVQTYAKELDFIVVDLENYPVLSAYYLELTSVLTEEQLQKWQDYFVYVEKDELDKLTTEFSDQVVLPKYHMSTEGMNDPVPLGIRLPENSKLLEAYTYLSKDVIFGITRGVQNTENTLAFLEYILN
jgi:hypothetical protein